MPKKSEWAKQDWIPIVPTAEDWNILQNIFQSNGDIADLINRLRDVNNTPVPITPNPWSEIKKSANLRLKKICMQFKFVSSYKGGHAKREYFIQLHGLPTSTGECILDEPSSKATITINLTGSPNLGKIRESISYGNGSVMKRAQMSITAEGIFSITFRLD
jgi:hypothetical protein